MKAKFVGFLASVQFMFLLAKGFAVLVGMELPWVVVLIPLWLLFGVAVAFWFFFGVLVALLGK